MNTEKFALPAPPATDEVSFIPGGFAYAGRLCIMRGAKRRAMECMVKADGPVGYRELFAACFDHEPSRDHREVDKSALCNVITRLRKQLRVYLGLGDNWNPIALVATEQWDGDTRYALTLPPVANQKEAKL